MVSTSIHVKIAVDYSAVVASDAATFLQSSFLLLGGTCFGQAAGVVYMWSTRRAPQSCAMCATSAQGCDEEPHALKNGTRAACARRPRHRSGGVGGGEGHFRSSSYSSGISVVDTQQFPVQNRRRSSLSILSPVKSPSWGNVQFRSTCRIV